MNRILQQPSPGRLASFKTIASCQLTSGSISLVASSAMAIMILRTEKRLSTPYRRIIFGISIADIILSFGLVIGPVFVPGGTPSSWGVGNEGTCKMVGFMLIWGVNMVPMYTCFLCWYYLCKLKYHMTNDAFGHKFERKGHIVIILVSLSLAMTALGLDTIHTTAFRTTCQLAVAPLGCRIIPEVVGECDATIETRVNKFTILNHSLRILWLFGMIAIMSMLYHHVVTTNRIFHPRSSESRWTNTDQNECVDENDEEVSSSSSLMSRLPTPVGRSQHQAANQTRAQENALFLSALYRNEIALQGTCYVGAYCLMYLPTIILYGFLMVNGSPPKAIQILAYILNPLGGLFTILVYTRPQIAHLRRNSPEQSRLKCFWLVLKAGGEVPEELGNDDDQDGDDSSNYTRGNLRAHRLRQQRQPGEVSAISSVQFGLPSITSQTTEDIISKKKPLSNDNAKLNLRPKCAKIIKESINNASNVGMKGESISVGEDVVDKNSYLKGGSPRHPVRSPHKSGIIIDSACFEDLESSLTISSIEQPDENKGNLNISETEITIIDTRKGLVPLKTKADTSKSARSSKEEVSENEVSNYEHHSSQGHPKEEDKSYLDGASSGLDFWDTSDFNIQRKSRLVSVLK